MTLSSGYYQFVSATRLVFNRSDTYWNNSDPIRNLSSDGMLLSGTTGSTNNHIVADVGQSVLRRLTLDADGNLRVYSLQSSGQWLVVW